MKSILESSWHLVSEISMPSRNSKKLYGGRLGSYWKFDVTSTMDKTLPIVQRNVCAYHNNLPGQSVHNSTSWKWQNRTKHLDVRYVFSSLKIRKGEVKVACCLTHNMFRDFSQNHFKAHYSHEWEKKYSFCPVTQMHSCTGVCWKRTNYPWRTQIMRSNKARDVKRGNLYKGLKKSLWEIK